MLKVAAYCRVSTEKEEQLDSLKKQIEYFQEFARNMGYELIEVYADEGISGKQMKNRIRFLEMLRDAEQHKFDLILVKDISRFSRNTMDFLTALRRLKSLNVDVKFVNNSQTAFEGSEFMLTMLAAIAQEESAKLSERIRWGKNITAKKGRVPNFVFGYDKIDSYTLAINKNESEIVKKMYNLLINEGYGTGRIAQYLNKLKVPTKKKKTSSWYQKTVIEILRNPIYTGKIINKKSEVADFITGTRRKIEKEKQLVAERPEIRIISDELYDKALKILQERKDTFKLAGKRESIKYPFSNLIKCSECGYSFRRLQRQYTPDGKVYKSWVCSLRNAKGRDACSNKTVVDEDGLLEYLREQFELLIKSSEHFCSKVVREIQKVLNEQNKNTLKSTEEYKKELDALDKKKSKYTEMYANEVITMEELKKFTDHINEDIKSINIKLCHAGNKEKIYYVAKNAIYEYMERVQNGACSLYFQNEELKQIIDKIQVCPDGSVDVLLKTADEIKIPDTVTLINKQYIKT